MLNHRFSFKYTSLSFFFLCSIVWISTCVNGSQVSSVVKKDEIVTVTETEFGKISSVKISDGITGPYHLQFITLEPNSLFLPVLLHAHVVLYVASGAGSLSWIVNEDMNDINLKRGDIYRLQAGSVFFVKSSLESTREKLRINAIFTNSIIDNPFQLFTGPYSTLSELVTRFDEKVLRAVFVVSEEVIENITRASKPQQIVHAPSKNETDQVDLKNRIIQVLTGSSELNKKKKKKDKIFNILEKTPDVKNCFGWSTSVNGQDLSSLKGSNIGVFMVNLTEDSLMGPHWNPLATEIAIVTEGQGMVRVVCPSMANEAECKNTRFRVKEGDVFAVPRYHPMAQMSFVNETFVFMGFSTMAGRNHPQFLAGKSSVLQTLDRDILAMSFNVPNTIIDQLLASQADSIILRCQFCAEEEDERMQEEIGKKKREEEKMEEEEAKRRKEEAKRQKEEEEARKREEQEAKKREARRKEEAKKREEEEEAKKREEGRRRKEEEERKREQKREKEEARRKQEEEEEAQRQQEQKQKRKQEEEEEEATREEEERQRKQEEKEAQKEERGKEEARRKQEEEEEAQRQHEEKQKREQEEEEARREEEKRQRRQEEKEARREEKERQRQRQTEEAAARRAEQERQRRIEEEARREEREQREREREEGEEQGGQGGGGGGGGWRKIFMY